MITLLPLQGKKFPEELKSDFRWIISQSTKYEPEAPSYWGDIETMTRRIRNYTDQKIAERFFHIYLRLQDIQGFPLFNSRDPRK